jgi:hypothetical protein
VGQKLIIKLLRIIEHIKSLRPLDMNRCWGKTISKIIPCLSDIGFEMGQGAARLGL